MLSLNPQVSTPEVSVATSPVNNIALSIPIAIAHTIHMTVE